MVGYIDRPIKVPCGQCVGCRLERSREWAVRCIHEAQLYDQNAFITLTYNDDHLPADRSLDHRHWQLFHKKLRDRLGRSIRFYMCGEYGSKNLRPHFHAVLFGVTFDDMYLHSTSPSGERLFRSQVLEETWGKGFCTIGSVTFESAAYVARYIMKKVNGEFADDHYQWSDDDGVIHKLKPEYNQPSLKPGLGKDWLLKYFSDVYPSDEVIVRGKASKPPRYYDKLCQELDPDLWKKVRRARIQNAAQHVDNNTPERLQVRERVQVERLKRLPRKLE